VSPLTSTPRRVPALEIAANGEVAEASPLEEIAHLERLARHHLERQHAARREPPRRGPRGRAREPCRAARPAAVAVVRGSPRSIDGAQAIYGGVFTEQFLGFSTHPAPSVARTSRARR